MRHIFKFGLIALSVLFISILIINKSTKPVIASGCLGSGYFTNKCVLDGYVYNWVFMKDQNYQGADASQLIDSLRQFINSSNQQDQYGAAFIIDTMLGGSNTVSYAQSHFSQWETLVMSYYKAHLIKSVSYQTFMGYYPGPYIQNSLYDSYITDDAQISELKANITDESDVLVFYSPITGQPIYAIKENCGNPIGSLNSFPNWSLTGQSSVTPTTAIAGKSVTFTHQVTNTGPDPAPHYSVKVYTYYPPPSKTYLTNIAGSGSLDVGQVGLKRSNSYTIPTSAQVGSKYCQSITYSPVDNGMGSQSTTPACVKVIAANQWDLTGTSTVSATTAEPGQSVTFTHVVANNSGYDMPSTIIGKDTVNWTQGKSGQALGTINFTPTTYLKNGSRITPRTDSFPIPATALTGTQYCQDITFTPGSQSSSSGQSTPACVTVKASTSVNPNYQAMATATDYEQGSPFTDVFQAGASYSSSPCYTGLHYETANETVIITTNGVVGQPSSFPISQLAPNAFSPSDYTYSSTTTNPTTGEITTTTTRVIIEPTTPTAVDYWKIGDTIGQINWTSTSSLGGTPVFGSVLILNCRSNFGLQSIPIDTQVVNASPMPVSETRTVTLTSCQQTADPSYLKTIDVSGCSGAQSSTSRVYQEPYARFYGNDVYAKSVIFNNLGTSQGAASQYAAIANSIIGFCTAAFRSSPPKPTTGLSVTNVPTNQYDGMYAFITNPANNYIPAIATSSFSGGSLPTTDGYYTTQGNINIDQSLDINHKITINNLSGDITITGNIITTGASSPFVDATTPVVLIMANGDIKIDPDVTRIDAILIAKGSIDTCSTGISCTQKLIINGALSAASVNLGRSEGTRYLAQSNEDINNIGGNMPNNGGGLNQAAEIINFPNYLYFATPYLNNINTTGFQAIFNAAPLL